MDQKTGQIEELPEIGSHWAGRGNPENRRAKLPELIPGDEAAREYAGHFKSHGRGKAAWNVQFALGTSRFSKS